MKRTPSRKKPTVADLDASLSVLHQVVVDMQTREVLHVDTMARLEARIVVEEEYAHDLLMLKQSVDSVLKHRIELVTLAERQDQLRDRQNKLEAKVEALEAIKQPWYRRLWARYTEVARGVLVDRRVWREEK